MKNFAQKPFRKGFSCKPTGMWASIMGDTRKSSFWAVDYFFHPSGTNYISVVIKVKAELYFSCYIMAAKNQTQQNQ